MSTIFLQKQFRELKIACLSRRARKCNGKEILGIEIISKNNNAGICLTGLKLGLFSLSGTTMDSFDHSSPLRLATESFHFRVYLTLQVVQACDAVRPRYSGCASAFSQNNVNLRLKVNFPCHLSPNTGSF